MDKASNRKGKIMTMCETMSNYPSGYGCIKKKKSRHCPSCKRKIASDELIICVGCDKEICLKCAEENPAGEPLCVACFDMQTNDV
jgi:hypothetical protein